MGGIGAVQTGQHLFPLLSEKEYVRLELETEKEGRSGQSPDR